MTLMAQYWQFSLTSFLLFAWGGGSAAATFLTISSSSGVSSGTRTKYCKIKGSVRRKCTQCGGDR